MKSTNYFSSIALLICIFATVLTIHTEKVGAQTPPQAQPQWRPGVYQVNGKHSQFGDYQGRAVLFSDASVQRHIQFAQAWNGTGQAFKLEQIWDGQWSPTNISFRIRAANTLSKFNNFELSKAELNFQQIVLAGAAQSQATEMHVAQDGIYSESWTLINNFADANAEAQARSTVVLNQRMKLDALGNRDSFAVDIAKKLVINKIIEEYRQLPELTPYRQREEFAKNQQWQILDFTDLGFYRQNPSALRIRQMSLNPLALAEAQMRRNAFAPSLAQKALWKEQEMETYALNSAGVLELSLVDPARNKVQAIHENDAALWTGTYAWIQALQYELTQDPKSLARLKIVLRGLLNLMEITNDEKQFARTIILSSAAENLGPAFHQGTGKFKDYKWLSPSNNDMAKGLFIGFAAAYRALPQSEASLRQEIQQAVQRLPKIQAIRERGFNLGIAYGLIALWSESDKNEPAFAEYVKRMNNLENVLADWTHLDAGFHSGGIADWSGVQLSMMSTVSQILISDNLFHRSSASQKSVVKKLLDQGKSRIKKMSDTYFKAHRGFLNVVAYAMTLDPNYKALAQVSLNTLLEIPFPHSLGEMQADLTRQPDWCVSSFPVNPWKAIAGPLKIKKEELTFERRKQGAYAYPIYEGLGFQSTYLWKDNPNYTSFTGTNRLVTLSTDYLLIYWLAKRAGLNLEI